MIVNHLSRIIFFNYKSPNAGRMAPSLSIFSSVTRPSFFFFSNTKHSRCSKPFRAQHNSANSAFLIRKCQSQAVMEEDKEILSQYYQRLTQHSKFQMGYPVNLDFDYSVLDRFLRLYINNVGDPFVEGRFGLNSKEFEREVLDWFAGLWEVEKEGYWGYVTSGGTEGNMHGILLGRELHLDGIFYASRESHYSVFKAARMFRMQFEQVDTLASGQIDCADFKERLVKHKGKPAIVNVNIGTTMKGAVDDLDWVIKTLQESGLTHDQFYIHCDGALSGFMMHFIKGAPKLSFKRSAIGSISVSAHKFIGCPMPCGVQMTKIEHIKKVSRDVEYIDSRDATILGSRNGHTPLFMWIALQRRSLNEFTEQVEECLKNARYLKERLENAGVRVILNEWSNTVVFERPRDEVVKKWQLACEKDIAHVVVMQHISVSTINSFVDEFLEKRESWHRNDKILK